MGDTIQKFRDLLDRNAYIKNKTNEFYSLCKKERDIFHLIVQGKKMQEISEQLLITLGEAQNYWENTKTKLNLKSNNDILRFSTTLQFQKMKKVGIH